MRLRRSFITAGITAGALALIGGAAATKSGKTITYTIAVSGTT